MWGSILEDNPSRPFYEVQGPTELANQKNKGVKMVFCGDDFVMAIGKDICISKPKKTVQEDTQQAQTAESNYFNN